MTDYDRIGNRDEWPITADCGCEDESLSVVVSPADRLKAIPAGGGPQGPPGPKGDTGAQGPQGPAGEVDYNRVESYVNARINQVFAPVNSRMDALQHDIDEKIKLTDWMEA